MNSWTMPDQKLWTDPSMVEMHRLPMHTPMTGFDRQSLDGEWTLTMFENPEVVGIGPGGAPVAVPGNWTMQDLSGTALDGTDFVDLPQYTNVQMPFAGPPPKLPERNPTGVYRRSFEIGAEWTANGDQIVVGVEGAESAHLVFLNGTFIGYGTDSRLPSEYDLTPFVVEGTNEIAIVVVKFCAHSYVEDQDHWWMGGLHRSVWVERRPATHIGDIAISTGFDADTGTGSLNIAATTNFTTEPEEGWTVHTRVLDPAGTEIATNTGAVPHHHRQPYVFRGYTVHHDLEVATAVPWSAEDPKRYRVEVELRSPSGDLVQQESPLVGLVSVETKDRHLLVNGQPIWIFGVNRHDHHPERGKTVTVADMRADLELMAKFNINAVRTAHYPNDHRFLDLCDELGFYVIDEANIESHAYNRSLCDDERYLATWVSRGSRMVQRDRNHPCVIAWSLGNEAGYGTNHAALAGWIRKTDPTRVLHCEEAITTEGWIDGGREGTDLVCPMYPSHAQIADYANDPNGDRPLIMCEYSHAMGNSNGGLAEYWDLITTMPGLQGGFLWEWKDHGLRRQLPDGTTRLAYGGMFDEEIHDGNFVADGLVSADLEPHPAMWEVAWVYRPVTVSLDTEGSDQRLRIENRYSFRDLSGLRCVWEFVGTGSEPSTGTLAMGDVGPHSSVLVPLPTEVDGDGWLTLRFMLGADTWHSEAGHTVASDQIVLGHPVADHATLGDRARSESVVDEPAPWSEPEPALARAVIDNDGFKLLPGYSRIHGIGGKSMLRWEDSGVGTRPAAELVDHSVEVSSSDDGTRYRHQIEVPTELADLPRIGVSFTVPARFNQLRWFGRGPHENYPDRNRSAHVGVWESEVDELPYLVPQEFGLRTECSWLEMSDPHGNSITVVVASGNTLHMSVTPYSAAELQAASHQDDLEPGERLVVHLDAAHRGIGTASCGPDTLDRHLLPAGTFELDYQISYSTNPAPAEG